MLIGPEIYLFALEIHKIFFLKTINDATDLCVHLALLAIWIMGIKQAGSLVAVANAHSILASC